MENKFYKINQTGGSYVVALFYNPITKESVSKCVRDYDYADCSRDNDDLYYMPINEEAKKQYYHDNGIILVGDKARVIKGRTLKHGFVGIVKDIKEYKNKYGKWIADYLYFEDGNKININNCELIKEDE